MQSPLPAIPIARAQRWRQIRRQVLPGAIFLGGVVTTIVVWREWVAPPAFVAEAEMLTTELRAPQAGWLAELNVEPLAAIQEGALLGHVITTDPRIVEASLAVIRAEVEFMLATSQPATDQQRVALERERLQLEWMQQRVELAALRVRVQHAEADLARSAALQAKQLLNEQSFDGIKARRDALAAQLAEQEKLVARLAPVLGDDATPANGNETSPLPSAVSALRTGLKVQEEKLRLAEAQLSPVPLRAPRAGTVTAVLRRSGEVVAAGEPVLRIVAPRAERLVGFVRLPLAFEPKPGAKVEVRGRGYDRRVGTATILEVGAAFEPISPTLRAALRLSDANELGLRVHVSRPLGLALRPGEPVDVVLSAERP